MDLARNIAVFMVICMHVTAAWKYGETATFKWHISELYDVICRSAVPLFFMMSGAFYKKAPVKKTVNKLVKFAGIFFGISLLYALSDAYQISISGGEIQENQVLNGILNYKYHLWYLPEYVFVLSIAPVIVKIIDEDNEKTTEYLIGLWIVLGIIPNTILTAVSGFQKYDMLNRYIGFFSSFSFLSGNHIGYFILGRYLSGKRLSTEKRAVIYALGILATFTLFVLTHWYSHYTGYGDTRWLSTLNIFVLIQAASLFILFSNITITGKSAAVVKLLSKYTFGIYLIHVFFLDWSYTFGIFTENGIWKYAVNPIFNTPIRVMIIYGASFLCVFLIKKAMNGLKTLFIA